MQENNEIIKFSITGDFCPVYRTEGICKEKNFELLFKDYIEIFRNSDFNITNLECPLTNAPEPIDKVGPKLKSDPACIQSMRYAKLNVATLANNHIMDYGDEGLLDTIDYCRQNNIQIVGAGRNISEASRFLTIPIKGRKISIVNFCENEFSIAGRDSPGTNPYSPIQNYYQIKEAKSKSDIIIVIIHGGIEQYKYPTPRMKEAYRFFIDSGADAVIGHHTHCIAGYEIYKRKPILYSLGNFLFDYPNQQKSWHTGVISQFTLENNNKLTFILIPFFQFAPNTFGLTKPADDESLFIFNEIKALSNKINDDIYLERELFLLSLEKRKNMLTNIFSFNRVHKKVLYWFFPERYILNNWRKKRLRNYFLCEAHRDLFETILRK
jgi:poly-gamma-glutamate synthesis protein (capsule biosynthesis protein)